LSGSKATAQSQRRSLSPDDTRAIYSKAISLRHLIEIFSNSLQPVCIRIAPLLLKISAVD
jgi:hypothetical protein